MDIYKEASRRKLRFLTDRGPLAVETLWDLPLTFLNGLIKGVHKQIQETIGGDDLSFLDDSSQKVDSSLKLKFDILKDVYLTKKEDNLKARNEKSRKEEEQYLLGLLKEAQDDELRGNPDKIKERLEKIQKDK
jgi:hypothetical protein